MLRPRLYIRTFSFHKLITTINNCARQGYILEGIRTKRIWLIWTWYVAVFRLKSVYSESVDINVGPITDK